MKETGKQQPCRSTSKQSNNPTIHPPPRLQTQRQYWRGVLFTAGPQRDQLRTRRADEELVEYAALFEQLEKGSAIESRENCRH